MGKAVVKVAYKPDSQSTEEFIVIVNPVEYKKWKDGDTSIPLTDVVDSFDIFHSNTGNQGHLGKASKQQLESTFSTSKDVDCVQVILEKGKSLASDAISEHTFLTNNAARGSATIDTRGGNRTTGV